VKDVIGSILPLAIAVTISPIPIIAEILLLFTKKPVANAASYRGVSYTYGIGEFDVTVSQYVTFLNTVDPRGRNTLQLYFDDMSPTTWPQSGPVSYTSGAGVGQHYSVAYPEWADKPFNFANFSRAARFANSLTNGRVLSRTQSTSRGFKYVTYEVRLSPDTERGMYDLSNPATTRAKRALPC
jgi:hypothetical protein